MALTRAFLNSQFDRKTSTPLIINGDMAIAQRGTSFSSLSSSQYCLDRFSTDIGGGGAITVTQDTDVPSNEFTKSMKSVVATADSSIAGADAYRITHSIEGGNIATVGLGTSGCQTMTLTFWVRSSVTGTYGIGFANNAETENYVDEYTISSADTWEKKVINIPVRTSGTFLTTNGIGLGIRWDLGSGTNYNGTAGQWQTTSAKVYRTSSCVNWIATGSATFYITGVQLEIGTYNPNSLPNFQHEDASTSLMRCQRYFYKTYRQGIAVGTDDVTDIISKRNEMSSNKTDMVLNIAYSVPMRATPTIVSYSKAGNSNKYLITGIDYSGGSEGTFAGTVYRGRKYLNQLSSGTVVPSGSYAHFHFTASAEL